MRVPEHARRPTKHVAEGYLDALSRENVYLKTREAIDRPADKRNEIHRGQEDDSESPKKWRRGRERAYQDTRGCQRSTSPRKENSEFIILPVIVIHTEAALGLAVYKVVRTFDRSKGRLIIVERFSNC